MEKRKYKLKKGIQNLSGTKINNIFVQYVLDSKTKEGHLNYLCLCLLCNKEFIRSTSSIKRSKHCGCTTDHSKTKIKKSELEIGKVYNKLTVIDYNKKEPHKLLCECFCGKKKVISKYYLKSNSVKSCGCLKVEFNKRKRLINSNINKRIHRFMHNSVRRVLKNKNECSKEILGYTKQELINHIESKFDENMSWNNYGTYWHIDHIIPVSYYINNNILDPRIINALSNLQPLEAIENMKKSNKLNYIKKKP